MDAGSCPLLSHPSTTDLGTIFRELGDRFLEKERLTSHQKRVFRRIAECRTAALGGALWHCQDCGEWVGVYHSCRDRHCPQCQGERRYQWVQKRIQELLPVPYFHIVFTLPHESNPLVLHNSKECLGLLFQSAAQTLLAFASDPNFLGAEPAITMVLHTWGQKLNLHYHVHCIVTGGGYNKKKSRWVSPNKNDFLFPVRAMAQVFRGKYLSGLDRLWRKGLVFPKTVSPHRDWVAFKRRLAKKKRWHVYAKEPFGSPEQLVKYLAQYTHRVAISNSRILSYKNSLVRFRYKHYNKQAYCQKTMTLTDSKFAKRFLLHVLPRGFMRIRHYGFLANCKKKASLEAVHQLMVILGWKPIPSEDANLYGSTKDPENLKCPENGNTELDGPLEARTCPKCQTGKLEWVRELSSMDQKRARCDLWDSS